VSASKLAVVSDIHGNAVALDAVFADMARRRAGRLVCLGDIAAGGPQPCEAIEALRSRGCPVVRGNADEWLLDGLPAEAGDETLRLRRIVEWARQRLSREDVEFLRSSQATIELELRGAVAVHCFHGSPRSNRERILPTTPEAKLDQLLAGVRALILLGGHTHWQMLRRYRGGLLVNVGSVGLPVGSLDPRAPGGRRLPHWAEYAVIEAGRRSVSVELCRVAVDAAALERAARETGMPHAGRWAADLERRARTQNAASIGAGAPARKAARTGAPR
jgi:predicted phosphodiesterase